MKRQAPAFTPSPSIPAKAARLAIIISQTRAEYVCLTFEQMETLQLPSLGLSQTLETLRQLVAD